LSQVFAFVASFRVCRKFSRLSQVLAFVASFRVCRKFSRLSQVLAFVAIIFANYLISLLFLR
ncbi:MAG: hypothetical protein RR993_04485, partial [Clostridia bacterium]